MALLSAGGPDAASVLISAEQIRRVQRALAELPLLQRMAIELAYYEGLTQQEIAHEQGFVDRVYRQLDVSTKAAEALASLYIP